MGERNGRERDSNKKKKRSFEVENNISKIRNKINNKKEDDATKKHRCLIKDRTAEAGPEKKGKHFTSEIKKEMALD